MSTYSTPSKWRLTPIHSVSIMVNSTQVKFVNLKQGSTWGIKPILRKNDEGGQSVLAYKFEGKFIVFQNNYQDMISDLNLLQTYNPTDIDLELTAPTNQSATGKLWVTIDGKIDGVDPALKKWFVNWEISQSDLSPNLIINVSGFFSKDILLFNGADPLPFIKQYWT